MERPINIDCAPVFEDAALEPRKAKTILTAGMGTRGRKIKIQNDDNPLTSKPEYRYNHITGEKVKAIYRPDWMKPGGSDHAVNVPISVSGLGVSQPRNVSMGVNYSSQKIIAEDKAMHFRSTKEPSDKFQIPITSAMEVAFHPAQPGDAYFHPPMFGRKACDVTVIEEYQIMGPRMP